MKTKICKNCKHYTPWFRELSGYCYEIFKHLGIPDSEVESLGYAELKETFHCGVFKNKPDKFVRGKVD